MVTERLTCLPTLCPPKQNNLGELFMLMHFLEPAKFVSQEEFEAQFSDLGREQQVRLLYITTPLFPFFSTFVFFFELCLVGSGAGAAGAAVYPCDYPPFSPSVLGFD